MLDVIVRPGRVGDGPGIVAAIRSGFDAAFVELFIYGCSGITDFVEDQIRAQGLGCETTYTVADSAGDVVGCVEMRLRGLTLFLNQISVAPTWRSGGLGKALLGAAIRESRGQTCSEMRLDVLDSNLTALRWYERLGFKCEGVTVWWEVSARPGSPPDYAVGGWPQAEACHARFGFSEFTLLTGRGEYRIGRLGNKWFRLVDQLALQDPECTMALARLDPGRRVLAVLPEGSLPSGVAGQSRRLACTLRMAVDLDLLGVRLMATP
jgi:GNAT superfamily N-acetyltransferase